MRIPLLAKLALLALLLAPPAAWFAYAKNEPHESHEPPAPALASFRFRHNANSPLISAIKKATGLEHLRLKITFKDPGGNPKTWTILDPEKEGTEYLNSSRSIPFPGHMQEFEKAVSKKKLTVQAELVNEDDMPDSRLRNWKLQLSGHNPKQIPATTDPLTYPAGVTTNHEVTDLIIEICDASPPPAETVGGSILTLYAMDRHAESIAPNLPDWIEFGKMTALTEIAISFATSTEKRYVPLSKAGELKKLQETGEAPVSDPVLTWARTENTRKPLTVSVVFKQGADYSPLSPPTSPGAPCYAFHIQALAKGAPKPEPADLKPFIVLKVGTLEKMASLYALPVPKGISADNPAAPAPGPPVADSPMYEVSFAPPKPGNTTGVWTIGQALYLEGKDTSPFLTVDDLEKLGKGEKVRKSLPADIDLSSTPSLRLHIQKSGGKPDLYIYMTAPSLRLFTVAQVSLVDGGSRHLQMLVKHTVSQLNASTLDLPALKGYRIEAWDAEPTEQKPIHVMDPGPLLDWDRTEPAPIFVWEKLDPVDTKFTLAFAPSPGVPGGKLALHFTIEAKQMKAFATKPYTTPNDFVKSAKSISLVFNTSLFDLLGTGEPLLLTSPKALSRLRWLDKHLDSDGFLRGLEQATTPTKPPHYYSAGAKERGILFLVDNYAPWERVDHLKESLWKAASEWFKDTPPSVELLLAAGVVNQRYEPLPDASFSSREQVRDETLRLERVTLNEFGGENGHYPVEVSRILTGEDRRSIPANDALTKLLPKAKSWIVIVVLPPPRFNHQHQLINPLGETVSERGSRNAGSTEIQLPDFLSSLEQPDQGKGAALEEALKERNLDLRYLVLKTTPTPPIPWGNARHEEVEPTDLVDTTPFDTAGKDQPKLSPEERKKKMDALNAAMPGIIRTKLENLLK